MLVNLPILEMFQIIGIGCYWIFNCICLLFLHLEWVFYDDKGQANLERNYNLLTLLNVKWANLHFHSLHYNVGMLKFTCSEWLILFIFQKKNCMERKYDASQLKYL